MLEFNRLSIQDITYAGHQSMESMDKICIITFNGEIHNVKELRAELEFSSKYSVFRGNSDTEVVLNMYQEYGFYNMINKLNGMLAIVIFDRVKNVLYIARDRFGIVPLHLCIDGEQIIWSSEIKAFLELPKFKREISEEAFILNTQYCYPNDPLFKQIENIEPGTIMEWDANTDTLNKVSFFDFNQYSQREFNPKHDYLEEASAVLLDCVTRQLIGDVELGVQLSGGRFYIISKSCS